MNYIIGILLAAASNMVIGMLWYSPVLFGDIWMRLAKVTPDPKRMVPGMVGGLISAVVMGFVMVSFMTRLGINTPIDGLYFGLQAWLGFVAPVTLSGVLWAGWPVGLYLLNNGYNAVSMGVMGMIISFFI